MSGLNYYFQIDDPEESKVAEPFFHYASIPGKKIRSKFVKLVNCWFQIPQQKLQLIEEVLEALHDASLLLDDIEDESDLRRGVPAVHSVYGIGNTVNAANLVILKCFEKLSLDKKGVDILNNRMLDLYVGQGMDIYWRDNSICPSIEEYKLMCSQKTGAVFLFCFELLQSYSNLRFDLSDFIKKFGIYFQIRDDYMNLCSDKYAVKKSFCDDISEGKFSFPIIHAVQARPGDNRILDILKQKTKVLETKKYCLSLLEEFGSLNYTKCVLEEIREELRKELETLPTKVPLLELLDGEYRKQNIIM